MDVIIYLWIWGIFNFCIGLFEVYGYMNKDNLVLEKETIWNNETKLLISNFGILAWSEYCKVDPRYIIKPYVWWFEIINFIISLVFIGLLITKNYNELKIVILLSILNCCVYFISLMLEYVYDEEVQNKIKMYSQPWMLVLYYFISSIWIIVPWMLYNMLG